MAIDRDKFSYKIGDRIRSKHGAEYEIVNIQATISNRNYTNVQHYRLQNKTKGCLDKPFWLTSGIVHETFEPCNPAVKLLFDKG